MRRPKTSLLIERSPLQVIPALAVAIGLEEAIVIQQIHYWLDKNRETGKYNTHYKDNAWWCWNTVEEWQETNFPFWSVSTVYRILKRLREPFEPGENDNRIARPPLIIAAQLSPMKYDRTLWYTIDYKALAEIECAIEEAEAKKALQITEQEGGITPDRQIPFSQLDEMECGSLTPPITETISETITENSTEKPKTVADATRASDSDKEFNELFGEPKQPPAGGSRASLLLTPEGRASIYANTRRDDNLTADNWDIDLVQKWFDQHKDAPQGKILEVARRLESSLGLVPVFNDFGSIKTWMSGIWECLKIAYDAGEKDVRLVVVVAQAMREEGLSIKNPHSCKGMVADAVAQVRMGKYAWPDQKKSRKLY
jgi:hypothetical protein